jgi:hypothetical protein
MKIPNGLQYWRPDEVAECLDGIGQDLYRKLWQITSDLEQSGKAVPVGGDGSNGTIECPPEPDAFMSGKMGTVWNQFTSDEQALMVKAFEANA